MGSKVVCKVVITNFFKFDLLLMHKIYTFNRTVVFKNLKIISVL